MTDTNSKILRTTSSEEHPKLHPHENELFHRVTTETETTERTNKHRSVDFAEMGDTQEDFLQLIEGTPAALALAGK